MIKRCMSVGLALSMLLSLTPITAIHADEVDAQKDATQVEEVQSDEDIVMQDKQVEEVEPDEGVAMQDEQVEEVKPDESVTMQDEQAEEAESDEDAVMEETVKPAVRMLAPAAVSPAASPEKIKEIELNLKPVTEITNINDFKSITYSPSDKITLKEVTVYNGYNSTSGSIASVYNSDKAYTVMYDFRYDENTYSLDSSFSKVKINSKYIQDWNCEFRWGYALQVYVSYPSLKDTVGVTFKPRDQWSGKISNMYVGHNLGDDYSVSLSYYNGLNQIDKRIDWDAAYDPTKDYSVCITIAGKYHAAIISPNLTKDDVTINYGTIWKVARDDYYGYTRIYVNFPRVEDSNTEYTVKAKNAEITNAAGEPVSKAKAGTVLTVKLKDLEKGYAFEKWVVDDNSTDVEFQNVKSTTTTFVMPKGEVSISPATLLIVNVRSKNLTYNGEEQTGVYLYDKYGGGSSVGTLTGHKATEAGTYTARASLKKGYIWSDGTTEDKNIVWTIAKADRDGPRGLGGYMPTKEGANDGGINLTTTEMEYRKVGTTTWKDCPDIEVTGLAPGDYEVRYKETKSYNSSIAIIYTVPIWGPKTWTTWIENGTPNGIQLPANATITITANPPEKGKEFDKWVPSASSAVSIEDEKSEVTKMTVLGGTVTVRATYKDKETPGVLKYDLNVMNGQGTGKYAYNKTVEITANPAPEGKEFDKWVVVEDTVAVADITKPKTTLTTKGVDAWVVATYKDIGSVAVDHTLTVVNGSIYSSSNPGKFKRNEAVTLYSKEIKNFDKWVVTSGSVVAILPNENTLNVTIITSDEDTTIEATRKSDASVHTHTYGAWSNDDADHWHECTDASCTDKAGSIKDKAVHVYDNDADTTCNICGYVRTITPPTPSHTHTYGAWVSDDTNHWHECTDASCGSIKDKAVHVYDNDMDDTCNVCGYKRVLPTPVVTYKFIEGANGSWTKNSGMILGFKVNGEISKFTGVKVDGTLIGNDKYTAVSGSTVVTLKKDYLETLSVGKHTLSVVYTDGECTTEFEVIADTKPTTSEDNKKPGTETEKPKPDVEKPTLPEEDKKPSTDTKKPTSSRVDKKTDVKSEKKKSLNTAYSYNMGQWMALLLMSGFVLVLTVFKKKRN